MFCITASRDGNIGSLTYCGTPDNDIYDFRVSLRNLHLKNASVSEESHKEWSLTGRRGGVGLNFNGLQVCPGRNDFKCCNQNIIQSKTNSPKWLERDSTEVTLTLDALHHPADILVCGVKDEPLLFPAVATETRSPAGACISAKVRVLFTGRH